MHLRAWARAVAASVFVVLLDALLRSAADAFVATVLLVVLHLLEHAILYLLSDGVWVYGDSLRDIRDF